jgi:hypothetical protein
MIARNSLSFLKKGGTAGSSSDELSSSSESVSMSSSRSMDFSSWDANSRNVSNTMHSPMLGSSVNEVRSMTAFFSLIPLGPSILFS